jgi:integrase
LGETDLIAAYEHPRVARGRGAANVPIEVVQHNLGHASLATTTIYVTSEPRRRYRETARFAQGGRGGASAAR